MTSREERFYNLVAYFAIWGLREREILILILRKFCWFTLQGIATDYNVSREWIRQIEARAIQKLLKNKKLRFILE